MTDYNILKYKITQLSSTDTFSIKNDIDTALKTGSISKQEYNELLDILRQTKEQIRLKQAKEPLNPLTIDDFAGLDSSDNLSLWSLVYSISNIFLPT